MAIEEIARLLNPEASAINKKESALFGFHEIETPNGDLFVFIKPKTFMNESGLAVKSVLKYFSARPSEVIIFHDDSDLPLGTIKISESSNLAGHRGLISVKTETKIVDFKRVRIGIRDPKEKNRKKAEEFVLKNIPKTKKGVLLGEALKTSLLKIL